MLRFLILCAVIIFVIFYYFSNVPNKRNFVIEESDEDYNHRSKKTKSFSDKVTKKLDSSTRITLVDGYATEEGTLEFSTNFLANTCVYSKVQDNILLSSVGIGTYLGPPDEDTDNSIISAIIASVTNGINHIDTAINYRAQLSEKAIGEALRKLFYAGKIKRSNLFIATKAGFIPADRTKGMSSHETMKEWSSNIPAEFEFSNQDVVHGKHCIAPYCIQKSIDKSRQNLGIKTIDLLYLHNVFEKQAGKVSNEDLKLRIKVAFTYLESLRKSNIIRYYGLATSQSFRIPMSKKKYSSLFELYEIAKEIGGESHGFRFIEVPISATALEAIHDKYQEQDMTLLQAAKVLNISVVSSKSLGGGKPDEFELISLAYQNCSTYLPHVDKPASMLLHFVRSIPGVTSALVGMKDPLHVKDNLEVLKYDTCNNIDYVQCMEETLIRSHTDKLGHKSNIDVMMDEKYVHGNHKKRRKRDESESTSEYLNTNMIERSRGSRNEGEQDTEVPDTEVEGEGQEEGLPEKEEMDFNVKRKRKSRKHRKKKHDRNFD